MLGETFLLECLSVLILLQLLQTSSTNYNAQCNPSACGWIPDIRYPFRLKGDPESCGDSSYELVCENNTASLYLNSQKYYVQAIDYQNFTIRLSDAALENSTCSFPQYSLFEYHFNDNCPYSVYSLKSPKSRDLHKINWPITFMSCPYAINSSFFLETAHCGNRVFDSNASYSSTRRYKYVKVGNLNASDVRDMCSIDLIVMTSSPFKDVNNLSLSDIQSSLLYGFELSWFTVTICQCKMKNSCSLCGNYLEGTIHFCLYGQYIWPWFDDLTWAFEVVPQYIMAINLALKILIGIPILFGLLICKWRRRHLSMFNAIEDFLRSQNNLMPISYSYSDIKKMTKGFREKLGEGGYGSVYKGKLRSGRDVAVKILGKINQMDKISSTRLQLLDEFIMSI